MAENEQASAGEFGVLAELVKGFCVSMKAVFQAALTIRLVARPNEPPEELLTEAEADRLLAVAAASFTAEYLRQQIGKLDEIINLIDKVEQTETTAILSGWLAGLSSAGRRTRSEVRRFLDAAGFKDKGYLVCSAGPKGIEARYTHRLDNDLLRDLGFPVEETQRP